MKFILLFVLSTLFALNSGFCAKKTDSSEKYINALFHFYVKQNIEKAAILFAEIVEVDSTHAASHHMLSRLLSSKIESLKHSEMAYRYDTTNIWYQTHLTDNYLKNKMYDKAIEMATKSLEQNPDNISSYTNLADIYIDSNDMERAEDIILNYEKKFGDTDRSMLYLLQIYNQTPAGLILISKLQKLADKNPLSELPLIVLGDKHMALKQHKKALEYYKKAEKMVPDDIRLILILSDYYLRTGNIEMITKYTKKNFASKKYSLEPKLLFIEEVLFSSFFYQKHYLELNDMIFTLLSYYPDNVKVNNIVAQHYINGRQLDKAYEQYCEIVDKGIAEEDTYLRIIGLKSYQKQFDEVLRYCNIILDNFPASRVKTIMQKAYAYTELNEHEKAIGLLQECLIGMEDKKELSDLYGMIGDTYHSWGKTTECYKSYNIALKHNPDNIVILNNYSYYLSLEKKQLKKALKMIRKVIKAEPDNSTYLDTFGWILYQMDKYDEAVGILKLAVEKNMSDSPEILLHYGDALYKTGKRISAKVYWKKALEAGAEADRIEERLKWD